ncbi:hypothetical protein CDCA_CDCA02G0473 [Cyanidium caldarium]|uniref:Association with the SNF1 complex (ASC) domain-containing protein n=1 Tax=Cyanidium caldarium TaxID=2771 RepID=A0AAV9IQD1_CYACA|nr:hypothetical protein CDCA_CDCA02G0473 [Cyanidium caldarium]
MGQVPSHTGGTLPEAPPPRPAGLSAVAERRAVAAAAAASVGAAPSASGGVLGPEPPPSPPLTPPHDPLQLPERGKKARSSAAARNGAALGAPEPASRLDVGLPPTPQLDEAEQGVKDMMLHAHPQQNLVPTMFQWNDDRAASVQVIGTFGAWKLGYPLHRSGKLFYALLDLEPGEYQYKYLVDGRWMTAPDQPTVADTQGIVNNVIRVEPFTGEFADEDDALPGTRRASYVFRRQPTDLSEYTLLMPSGELEYTQKPPALPVLLDNTTAPRMPADEDAERRRDVRDRQRRGEVDLFPQPPVGVTLNHLYTCVGSGDSSGERASVYTYAVTRRYRECYATLMFYMPAPRIDRRSPHAT